MKISLEQLYIAYRKAKKEAFGDPNCAHGLKFAEYERYLHSNLLRLGSILSDEASEWWMDAAFLGTTAYVTKSGEFRRFRQVIDASVDYMVVAASWVLEVGQLYDARLSSSVTAGRVTRLPDGGVDNKRLDLFEPFQSARPQWHRGAIAATIDIVRNNEDATIITLDLKRFNHAVDAVFLLNRQFQADLLINLDSERETFTRQFIESFATWNASHSSTIGLPAGLSASTLIGNVLLKQLDDKLEKLPGVAFYARHIDDIIMVVRGRLDLQNTDDVFRWLSDAAKPLLRLRFTQGGPEQGLELEVSMPNTEKTHLIFSTSKASVFPVPRGQSQHLLEKLEHSLKPFPNQECLDESIKDALKRMTEVANAPRSADYSLAKSLKRHRRAVTTLLNLLEARSSDDRPSRWKLVRQKCLRALGNMMLTDDGFFEYSKFYPRMVGLMAGTRDWNEAHLFVRKLIRLRSNLSGKGPLIALSQDALTKAFESLTRRMSEAVLATVTSGAEEALRLYIRILRLTATTVSSGVTSRDVRRQAELLRSVDWAKAPYWARWITSLRSEAWSWQIPAGLPETIFPVQAVMEFVHRDHLRSPHWPALLFPTRMIPAQVFDELVSDRESPSQHWMNLRVMMTDYLSAPHQGGAHPVSGVGADYDDGGGTSAMRHVLDGLGYQLLPLKTNSFFDLPPIFDTIPPFEEDFYVRFSQAEAGVTAEDGRELEFWRFEGFRGSWLTSEAGRCGWTSDREFVEYYQQASLIIIELEIADGNFKRVGRLKDLASDLSDGRDPDGWFKIRLRPDEGGDQSISGTLFPFLFGAGRRVNLDDIEPVTPSDRTRLDDAIKTGNVDEADTLEIERLLSPITKSGLHWAVVYDVGQGNCIGLCGANGSVRTYFDFGGGVAPNHSTFPSALTRFCFTDSPSVVLSHWDHDHWSSWRRDQRALAIEWLAPRQQLTAIHVALIASIQSGGGKLWFMPKGFLPTWFGHLHLEICTGSNRNNSGIALTISEKVNGGGGLMLMPGDADYRHIPSFRGGEYYLSVVAPHHGGPLYKTTPLPLCSGATISRLVYSAGSNNTYNHPHPKTRLDHDAQRWFDPRHSGPPHIVRLTEDRTISGLGHVLLGWQLHPAGQALPCGGKTCQLQAQQI